MASASTLALILSGHLGEMGAPTANDFNGLAALLAGGDPTAIGGGSTQARFAASIRLITFDGVDNAAANITDALTGRQQVSLLVRGQHGKHVEIEHSAGGKILYAYDEGIDIGVDTEVDADLTVTGLLTVNDLLVGGDLTVNGNTTLGDGPGDVVNVAGDFTVLGATQLGNAITDTVTIPGLVTIGSTLGVTGDTTLTTLHVTPANPGNDQSIFFRHNSAVPYFSLGATNSATPTAVFKDATGLEILNINPGTAVNTVEVLEGDFFAAEDAHITGSLDVGVNVLYVDTAAGQVGIGTAAPLAGYELDVQGDANFDGSVDVQTDLVVHTDLDVNGLTSLHSKLTVTAGGAEITGNSEVDGTLLVTGTVTLSTGDLDVLAGDVSFPNTTFGAFGATPISRPTVSGSRGGNAALADLLSELANLGWIVDSSSA